LRGFIVKRIVGYLALLFLSAAVFVGNSSPAGADVFYTASNYATGSAGVVAKNGSSFSVDRDVVSNFGLDAWGFTFRDHNGEERAMAREYQYGPNDTVFVWDPANFKVPIVNAKTWGSNIHAVASNGRSLYAATYESYKDGSAVQDAGEVVRLDMADRYNPDRRYRYEAFTGDAGFESSPHGEAIHIENGKIYVLFSVSYQGVNEYEPTEVVEFDADLNRLRSVKLTDSDGNAGRNATRMASYGGRLYVAHMGGYQGPDSWGDVWEVDFGGEAMTAKRVLDGHDIPYTVNRKSVNVGMYGIQFAQDGTAFLLTGSYDGDYVFRARLFITTASRLSNGDAGSVAAEYAGKLGYSWDILWDEADSALWCMTGASLEARAKDGSVLREFSARELGDNIYSISLLNGYVGGGDGGGGTGGSGGGGGGCSGGPGTAAIAVVLWLLLPRRRCVSIASDN
jgi:hypothetical protein